MSSYPPGRPVLSEACQRRAAEIVANWGPLSPQQRIRIAAAFRAGRRLAEATAQAHEQGSDAA